MRTILKKESGISMIEYVWVMATLGVVILLIGPAFTSTLAGDEEEDGFAGTIIESQTVNLSEDSTLQEGEGRVRLVIH